MNINRYYISKQFSVKNLWIRVIRKAYPRFLIYKRDVFLCAFPKSGSTWMRFILTNIISLMELNGLSVDYNLINGEMRASYDSFSFPKYESNRLPVFLATHKNFNKKIFQHNKILLIIRNPADTLVSYYEYLSHRKDKLKIKMSFSKFLQDQRIGFPAWADYYNGWFQNSNAIVKYEDLKLEPLKTITDVFEKFGIEVSNNIIKKAIDLSSFNKIREIENTIGLDKQAQKVLENNFHFARKGIIGDYKNYFNDEDYDYLMKNLSKLRNNPYSNFYEK